MDKFWEYVDWFGRAITGKYRIELMLGLAIFMLLFDEALGNFYHDPDIMILVCDWFIVFVSNLLAVYYVTKTADHIWNELKK